MFFTFIFEPKNSWQEEALLFLGSQRDAETLIVFELAGAAKNAETLIVFKLVETSKDVENRNLVAVIKTKSGFLLVELRF